MRTHNSLTRFLHIQLSNVTYYHNQMHRLLTHHSLQTAVQDPLLYGEVQDQPQVECTNL